MSAKIPLRTQVVVVVVVWGSWLVGVRLLILRTGDLVRGGGESSQEFKNIDLNKLGRWLAQVA